MNRDWKRWNCIHLAKSVKLWKMEDKFINVTWSREGLSISFPNQDFYHMQSKIEYYALKKKSVVF